MWAYVAVGYLVFGLGAAGFTLAVFPPQAGYRPPWHWVVLALLSYILLWPFLAMIAVGYLVGQWYQRTPAPRTTLLHPGRHWQLYRALYEETPN